MRYSLYERWCGHRSECRFGKFLSRATSQQEICARIGDGAIGHMLCGQVNREIKPKHPDAHGYAKVTHPEAKVHDGVKNLYKVREPIDRGPQLVSK